MVIDKTDSSLIQQDMLLFPSHWSATDCLLGLIVHELRVANYELRKVTEEMGIED